MRLRALSAGLSALMLLGSPALAAATDAIVLPPAVREFSSPGGAFSLRVRAQDDWKTAAAVGELRALKSGDSRLLWRRELPQHYGPRKALVSDRGETLLVDEWINVLSANALLLVDRDDRVIARYAADQVFAVLGVPARDFAALAREGPWLSDGPALSADGRHAIIHAGGRTLEIRLSDGRLTASGGRLP